MGLAQLSNDKNLSLFCVIFLPVISCVGNPHIFTGKHRFIDMGQTFPGFFVGCHCSIPCTEITLMTMTRLQNGNKMLEFSEFSKGGGGFIKRVDLIFLYSGNKIVCCF